MILELALIPSLGLGVLFTKAAAVPAGAEDHCSQKVTWLLLSLKKHQKLCYYLSSGDKHGQDIPASTQEPHQPKVFTDSDQCCQNRA